MHLSDNSSLAIRCKHLFFGQVTRILEMLGTVARAKGWVVLAGIWGINGL